MLRAAVVVLCAVAVTAATPDVRVSTPANTMSVQFTSARGEPVMVPVAMVSVVRGCWRASKTTNPTTLQRQQLLQYAPTQPLSTGGCTAPVPRVPAFSLLLHLLPMCSFALTGGRLLGCGIPVLRVPLWQGPQRWGVCRTGCGYGVPHLQHDRCAPPPTPPIPTSHHVTPRCAT